MPLSKKATTCSPGNFKWENAKNSGSDRKNLMYPDALLVGKRNERQEETTPKSIRANKLKRTRQKTMQRTIFSYLERFCENN